MSALRIRRDDQVLRIAMARPERHNAFDAALIGELTEAFADVGDARVVLLTGEGSSFSAGADVEWMRSSVELTYDENVADALRLRAMLDAIDSCLAPVVARVQGYALGGGIGLVACCDIVVAEPTAQFAFSEVKLGIVPAVISPFALAKIGSSAARRYFVTGERFDAETALRIGLVHEVDADLDAAVERILAELLTAGPAAARTAKALARAARSADETARAIAEHRSSVEGQEGLKAFLEKRPAAWPRLTGQSPSRPGRHSRRPGPRAAAPDWLGWTSQVCWLPGVVLRSPAAHVCPAAEAVACWNAVNASATIAPSACAWLVIAWFSSWVSPVPAASP